jgi:TRAP-type C4-dicarboxylate transport system substrate-binding protein
MPVRTPSPLDHPTPLAPPEAGRRRARLRHLAAMAVLPAMLLCGTALAQQKIAISHQFPGSSGDEGDFRDRMARKFASEVERRSASKLSFALYPGASLMKVNAQFAALRKGALGMSVLPLTYGSGEVPELNIVAMPGLVTSYAQARRWRNAPIGKALAALLEEKGIIVVSWVWQAGGAASRAGPFVTPDDAKGLKVRGGSREMDMLVKAAGGSALALPSNESYAAMQTGAVDVVTTSSTSLLSFRVNEVSKHLTFGRNGRAYWFQMVPLLMSKTLFDTLPKDQQTLIMAVGAEVEEFGAQAALADDRKIVDVFAASGAQIHELSDATIAQWVEVAKRSAWKDYAARSDNCARLLKLAEQVL